MMKSGNLQTEQLNFSFKFLAWNIFDGLQEKETVRG